jgi:Fe-S cluster biosynthesis and repair protein YggX
MAADSDQQGASIQCVRCGRQAPRQAAAPYPGALGDELLRRICADCWAEWQQVEVMVINELQLNFMDPRAQDVLVQQMREFLGLDPAAAE